MKKFSSLEKKNNPHDFNEEILQSEKIITRMISMKKFNTVIHSKMK